MSGTGHAAPDHTLTNDDLSRMVDTSDEWITTRTGIKSRHIASPGEANSDFATLAGKRALEAAQLKADQLDTIVVATVTGDLIFPSTACLVQDRLGASKAAAWDLSAACSGFLYGLSQATALIRSGMGRRALVIGSEMLSRIIDWEDRATCVLFGDGAGAAVLEAAEGEGGDVLATFMRSDGSLWELLHIPYGGTRNPVDAAILAARSNKVQMKGNEVFKYAVRSMSQAARSVMDAAGLGSGDVDLLIPHQANLRIIEALGERMEIDPSRILVNIQDFGNTSSASIPIALDQARRAGRIRPGHHVLMVAFGGGLTWGAVLVRF
jgi:3-oxoacyl-[acyl-carrier-protein] synthase-3